MGLFKRVAIATGAFVFLKILQKSAENSDDADDYDPDVEEWRRQWREEREREEKRKRTKCEFTDDLSSEDFKSIVLRSSRHFKRVRNVGVYGPIVIGFVKSHSNISEWKFNIDYNDFGRITGEYWLSSDNSDSNVPEKLAESIKNEIKKYRSNPQERTTNIYVPRPYYSCSFTDGITKYDFQQIVKESMSGNDRIEELKVFDAKIYGKTRSITGKTSWRFILDFNDNGHITGEYRCLTENDESNYMTHIGNNIKEAILQKHIKRGDTTQ